VRAGNYLRDIHHRDNRRAARRHFSGIEREIGHHTIDRARDSRVFELGLRGFIATLGSVALGCCRFDRLVASESLKISRRFFAVSY
jgi:hypothetical protein